MAAISRNFIHLRRSRTASCSTRRTSSRSAFGTGKAVRAPFESSSIYCAATKTHAVAGAFPDLPAVRHFDGTEAEPEHGGVLLGLHSVAEQRVQSPRERITVWHQGVRR